MAKHRSLQELGLPEAGLTQLAALDNRTPPPAESANEITGIAEPSREYAPQPTFTFPEYTA